MNYKTIRLEDQDKVGTALLVCDLDLGYCWLLGIRAYRVCGYSESLLIELVALALETAQEQFGTPVAVYVPISSRIELEVLVNLGFQPTHTAYVMEWKHASS